MTSVTIHTLDELWPDSHDEPYAVIDRADPAGQVGSYVIEPGERVPESGTTSHVGTEVSVILEGELRLVTTEEYHLGPGTVVHIPAGVEHYSENMGETDAKLVYTILGEL